MAAPTDAPRAPAGLPLPAAIDARVLKKLADDVGGEENLRELIASFMDEAPALLRSLRACFDQQDLKGVERAAHTLKSLSASFGAMGLSQTCRGIEDLARKGTLTPQAAVAEAEAGFAQVEGALARYPNV